MYIENPKTKKSGIYCAIPQKGYCPLKCDEECFYNNGRSYLEPINDNTPNLPTLKQVGNGVVRFNDGIDSFVNQSEVIHISKYYQNVFFNTSINKDLDKYPSPFVLTVNPGKITDIDFHKIPLPFPNTLMAVRARVNTWNLHLVDEVVKYYTQHDIAVLLTFMAYHKEDKIPELHKGFYIYRNRTMNKYFAINDEGFKIVMQHYENSPRVYSCGEGWKNKCKYCGNCLREYFLTKEKMRL